MWSKSCAKSINTVPENKKTTIHTYNNCQAIAVWTGIGYAFAALALSVGLREIADREIGSIDENQMRLGHFWDHWECGHHYTRPMSSWSTLIAASGMKVDYANKKLTFKLFIEDDYALLIFYCFSL